jgi:uncharacterized membrane protein YfcA
MYPVVIAVIIVLALSSLFALLGMGGASIYVPIFIYMGFPLEAALPAGLFLNMITSGTASFNYRKLLDLKAAVWIFLGTLIGAPIGAVLSTVIPERTILGIFSLVLLLGAYRLARPGKEPKESRKKLLEEEAGLVEGVGGSVLGTAMGWAAGAVTGTVSGLLGIGGGIFLVPFLIESGFKSKKASVLSHPVVFFASLFGLASHLVVAPELDINLMALTGAAAFAGAYAGSWKMANGTMIDDAVIRKAFTAILVIFAIFLAYSFVTGASIGVSGVE